MAKVACPACSQDWLVSATIEPLSLPIIFCPECEATWLPGQNYSVDQGQALAVCMEERGLPWDWNLLRVGAPIDE